MGAWEHGSMGTWEYGNMGVWEHGSMGTWEHGNKGRLVTNYQDGFIFVYSDVQQDALNRRRLFNQNVDLYL
jgi:hypothetical protein